LIAAHLLDNGYDAVVALGAVIEGETDHYEHVAARASEGLMQVMLSRGKPVAFGILTVREEMQALARSQPGPGNKGAEAAAAAVETAIVIRDMAGGSD
jgi:6,7-dimethyl-8-ribityllumazine synthase